MALAQAVARVRTHEPARAGATCAHGAMCFSFAPSEKVLRARVMGLEAIEPKKPVLILKSVSSNALMLPCVLLLASARLHTGGGLGMFEKAEQLAPLLSGQATRLQVPPLHTQSRL